MDMKTVYDVRQLLKKFGTYIYIGNRVADLELMEEEVKELYQNELINIQDYQMAVLILRQDARKNRDEKGAKE